MDINKQEKNKKFLIASYITFGIIFLLLVSFGIYITFTKGFPDIFDEERLKEISNEEKKTKILAQLRNPEITNKESLQILSEFVAKDSNNIYLLIEHSSLLEEDEWKKRHRYELIPLTNPKPDVQTLQVADKGESRIFNYKFYKDKNVVYYLKEKRDFSLSLNKPKEYELKELREVDIDSWQLINDSDYSKDKQNIFYSDGQIKGVDYSSFNYLGYGFARDKASV
tara:strand:- start:1507 stop:2181 length:675 start_codon:yes stop_codon:yes gene_type:complete